MADQSMANSDKIYNLEELLTDVYDFFYSKLDDFKTKYINTTDLNLRRFKLDDYDLDVIFENAKIQYVTSLPTGLKYDQETQAEVKQIILKRQGDIYMSNIRIVPYQNKESVTNMADPVNVNQIIKTLFAELYINDNTSNIILPIINVDVTGDDLIEYGILENHVEKGKFYSIQITEKFFKSMNLFSFMKDYPLNLAVIKRIIYQVVDVLYQINLYYPTFRYNQMTPEYLDCYLRNIEKEGVTIPEIKMSNYYLSQMDIIPNDYLKTINIEYIDSVYSDLYQFLNYLVNNFDATLKKYPELITLIDKILPKKIRSKELLLSKATWDLLSEDEKDDLNIKNIRNNSFFTSKDSLLNSTAIDSNRDDLFGGFSEDDSESSDDDSSKKDDQKTKRKNKKYYNNHIDSMKNKKSNKRDKHTDDHEITEERSDNHRPARIINTEDDIPAKNKRIKTYRGTRTINFNSAANRYDGANQAEPQDLQYLSDHAFDQARVSNANANANANGSAGASANANYSTSGNSLSSLFGAPTQNPSGLQSLQQMQAMQPMQAMPQGYPGYSNAPGQMTQAQMAQLAQTQAQMGQMGQIGQMGQMGPNAGAAAIKKTNDDALYRYLSATGQSGTTTDANAIAQYINSQPGNMAQSPYAQSMSMRPLNGTAAQDMMIDQYQPGLGAQAQTQFPMQSDFQSIPQFQPNMQTQAQMYGQPGVGSTAPMHDQSQIAQYIQQGQLPTNQAGGSNRSNFFFR